MKSASRSGSVSRETPAFLAWAPEAPDSAGRSTGNGEPGLTLTLSDLQNRSRVCPSTRCKRSNGVTVRDPSPSAR